MLVDPLIAELTDRHDHEVNRRGRGGEARRHGCTGVFVGDGVERDGPHDRDATERLDVRRRLEGSGAAAGQNDTLHAGRVKRAVSAAAISEVPPRTITCCGLSKASFMQDPTFQRGPTGCRDRGGARGQIERTFAGSIRRRTAANSPIRGYIVATSSGRRRASLAR